jgi:hypothetical protein
MPHCRESDDIAQDLVADTDVVGLAIEAELWDRV